MPAKNEQKIPYKIYLTEEEMPKAWYNMRSDMKVKPAPLLNPGTGAPMTAEELSGVFCEELVQQDLDEDTAYLKSRRKFRTSTRCTAQPRWSAPTVWKLSLIHI